MQRIRACRASQEECGGCGSGLEQAPLATRPARVEGFIFQKGVQVPMLAPIPVYDFRPRGSSATGRAAASTRAAPRLHAAFLLIAILVAAGCGWPAHAQSPAGAADPRAPLKPVPPIPIAVKKVELGEGDPWSPAWTRMIERALPRNLVSRRRAPAVRELCPRFRDMSAANRRAFWAYFFQALAGAEAGLKPTADVRHREPQVAVIDPVTHRIVRQEGLLQLAYEDSARYGCDFDWKRDKDLPEHDPEKTILEPRNNLMCGIRIAENQLIKQHKPLLSDSSYWVTLRPDSPSFKVFLRQMTNVPLACGSPLRRPVTNEIGLPLADEAEKTPPRDTVKPAAVDPHPDPRSNGQPAQHFSPAAASSSRTAANAPPLPQR